MEGLCAIAAAAGGREKTARRGATRTGANEQEGAGHGGQFSIIATLNQTAPGIPKRGHEVSS